MEAYLLVYSIGVAEVGSGQFTGSSSVVTGVLSVVWSGESRGI